MDRRTINIPADAVDDFKARVAKVNKKADKIGSESIIIASISKPFQQKYHQGDETFVRNIVTIEYQQPDIRIKGYSLVGMISRDSTGTIQIHNYNMNNFKDYQNPDFTRCDHCNTKHQRNHLVVLKDKSQKEIVVGKSCLKDFIGVVPSTYYKFVDEIHELQDDESYSNTGFSPAYPVLDVLSHTFDIASRYGFVKAGDVSNDTPTYQRVKEAITTGKSASNEAIKNAEEGIALFKNMEEDKIYNDYIFNIHQILNNTYVDCKRLPTACSSYIAIKNMMENKDKQKSGNDIYVGNIGDIMSFNVKVDFIKTLSGYISGESRLYVMTDNKTGAKIKTFTTSKKFLPDIGDEISIVGKIKKHEEFRGEKATIITNIKMLNII
jgi:hypothetical protein